MFHLPPKNGGENKNKGVPKSFPCFFFCFFFKVCLLRKRKVSSCFQTCHSKCWTKTRQFFQLDVGVPKVLTFSFREIDLLIDFYNSELQVLSNGIKIACSLVRLECSINKTYSQTFFFSFRTKTKLNLFFKLNLNTFRNSCSCWTANKKVDNKIGDRWKGEEAWKRIR